MQNLGSQSQFSDIGVGEELQMTPNVSPTSLFMALSFMIWAALFLYGRRQQREGKPANPNAGQGESGGSSGSGGPANSNGTGNNPNTGGALF